ncbi:MAG: conjugal transfer protein TraD [Candidatus Paracaedibacter sp.]
MMQNRNSSNFSRESYVLAQQSAQDRKLRTRTLIQAGGLLSLSGLLEQCDIFEGEDLQNDLHGHEKAATLLGILIEASETLLQNNDTNQLTNYKKIGEYRMKQAVTKYV